jgi:hypothetical protein
MTVSDSIKEKARSYLAQGRVKIIEVVGNHGSFEVSGSADTPYIVRYTGEWHCPCESRVPVCSHVYACQLITYFAPEQKLFFHDDSDLIAFLNS